MSLEAKHLEDCPACKMLVQRCIHDDDWGKCRDQWERHLDECEACLDYLVVADFDALEECPRGKELWLELVSCDLRSLREARNGK